jgi:hypothetical protein
MTRTLRHAVAALRAFLAGFTGLGGAQLAAGTHPQAGTPPPTHSCDGKLDAAAARHALEERSARRGTCC